eukprot:scaffold6.g2530.t1
MKLLVWNINALAPTARNAVLKYGSWLGFFQHHGLDIAALQARSKVIEDKLTKELACVEGFQSLWACSREKKGYSGVVTYASEAWAPLSAEADCLGTGDDDIDREGRIVVTDHGAFVLVNVYVPNAGDRPARSRLSYKLRFLEASLRDPALRSKCDALAAAGRELLIVGDFNVPAEPRDMHPSLGPYEDAYGAEEQAALAALMRTYPDVWRRLHSEESDTYTVWNEKTSARAFNQGLRIDYVLASPGLLDRVASCEVLSAKVLPPKWSDHAGILLELRDVEPPPPHPPCKAWQAVHRRYHDASQRSILSMLGKKRTMAAAGGAGGQAVAGAGGAQDSPEAAVAAGGGETAGAGGAQGQQEEQGQQRQKKARKAEPEGAADAPVDAGGSSTAAPAAAAAAGGGRGAAASSDGSAGAAQRQKAQGGSGSPIRAPGSGKAKGKGQQKEAAAGQRTIGSFFKSSQ